MGTLAKVRQGGIALQGDLALIVARHRRAGRKRPRLATALDMSGWAVTLLRSSVTLRQTVGSSFGTRAALRWVFKIDVWTDDIGPRLTLPHPFNIVIGAGVRIGADCTILHNTTVQHAQSTRIGDGVTLAVGSVILANRQVGDGAFCGANCVVTRDVPNYAVVGGAPARVLRRSPHSDRAPEETAHGR